MNIVYSIVIHVFWFLATYFVVLYILLLLDSRKKLFKDKVHKLKGNPFVSFVVAAYNEEKVIADTITSLAGINYPKDRYEILIINDGSKDRTAKVVKPFLKDSRVRFVDNKKNKGKAACLNQGISLARGTYVACMDADSVAEPDILLKALPVFSRKDIGAVTVAVRVRNANKLLTKLIELEYILGLSLLLRVFSFADAIYVTPGPFTIFSKQALDKIGGFDPHNITEDHEIALRLIKNGYKIANTMNAKVYTVSPDRFKPLLVQRKRWYTGSLLTFFQYKDMMFKSKYGMIGYLLPYNYFLILVGIFLVSTSLFLIVRNWIQTLAHFSLTNFNFFSHLSFVLDIYKYGQVDILSALSVLAMFITLFLGLKFSRIEARKKVTAIILYPFLFFLYQIFWASSFIAAATRRQVKWR